MKKIKQRSSLYIEVKNAILDDIQIGEIAVDDRLPSEETLAEMYSVSRVTVRNALQALENDRLITKRHGSDTTVNRICLGLNMRIDEAKGFIDLIAANGHTSASICKTLKKEIIKPIIAKKLNLSIDSEVLVLTDLLSGDGNPVVYLREYYPMSILHKEPTLDDIPSDIYLLSDSYFKKAISYTIREISAISESEELLQVMRLNSGTGFIKMEELHYSDDNIPIAYNETYIRDSITKLQVVCRRM